MSDVECSLITFLRLNKLLLSITQMNELISASVLRQNRPCSSFRTGDIDFQILKNFEKIEQNVEVKLNVHS